MLTNMEGTRLAGYFPIEDATTNGGDASRVGKRCSYYLIGFVLPCSLCPDAGRVAPIRASV